MVKRENTNKLTKIVAIAVMSLGLLGGLATVQASFHTAQDASANGYIDAMKVKENRNGYGLGD